MFLLPPPPAPTRISPLVYQIQTYCGEIRTIYILPRMIVKKYKNRYKNTKNIKKYLKKIQNSYLKYEIRILNTNWKIHNNAACGTIRIYLNTPHSPATKYKNGSFWPNRPCTHCSMSHRPDTHPTVHHTYMPYMVEHEGSHACHCLWLRLLSWGAETSGGRQDTYAICLKPTPHKCSGCRMKNHPFSY